ncbi:hypothetical protein PHISCL_01024 [Aspergillus sclerotialis]|uniref:Uncharacterized protein n=1 Tax=Aspergillus sclerotialis TaxID=2070753 RepID=A0A3A2ZV63_9EURO|nr:hypothetical protein PHISCL_01024 [Aspergillus sclerotialis]
MGYGDQTPGLTKGKGLTYCVKITGSQQPGDYLLGKDQSLNRCGQAYGPGYLLVNDITAEEKEIIAREGITGSDSRSWDPWWDNHLFPHTVKSIPVKDGNPETIETTMLPSQYGEYPAPGLKTFAYQNANGKRPQEGQWITIEDGLKIGKTVSRQPANADGTNLFWDDYNPNWAAGLNKRGQKADIPSTPTSPAIRQGDVPDAQNQNYGNTTIVNGHHHHHHAHHRHHHHGHYGHLRLHRQDQNQNLSSTGEVSADPYFPSIGLERRSDFLGGSFLDVNVYKQVLKCEKPWVDPCELDSADCYDEYDLTWASGSSGSSTGTGGSTTSATQSATTTTPSITSTPTAPLCYAASDPHSEGGKPWYPTISGVSGNICDYSTLPYTPTSITEAPTTTNPYPFTQTDIWGNVVECATWGVVDAGKSAVSYCSGSRSTIYTAPTPTYTYALWTTYEEIQNCNAFGGCRPVKEPPSIEAMGTDASKVCDPKYSSEMKDARVGNHEVTAPGLPSQMVFDNGVCGGPGPYWCNVTENTIPPIWSCADTNGGHKGSCYFPPLDQRRPQVGCPAGLESNIYKTLIAYCEGPWDCDS